MTTSLWDRLTASYPALNAKVAGEHPLKFAIDEYEAGRCATVVTARDLAADANA